MTEPFVYLVDDDSAVRDALALLVRSIGLSVVPYESPQRFLDEYDARKVGCLLLDIRMPGISGLTVQEILKSKGHVIPTVFITGHGDVAQCSRAFKAGAVDFLTKPVDEQVLIESLQKAIALSIDLHRKSKVNAAIQQKLGRLTEREYEVLNMMTEGMPNKAIARELGVTTRTVESHRAKVFEKLEVESLAECVKVKLASSGQIPI